jgi:site-specific DNA recombinase
MSIENAAIYVRVSTEEQTKGYSIEAQLEALRSYCKLHGINVFKEYVDAGYSGKSIDGRPLLKELLSDADKACFQRVICWKLNRLARNLHDLLQIIESFKLNKISFLSITEQFETDTPQGTFVLQMMGAAAELERGQIAENVAQGIRKRSKEGKWNSGNQVLGYEWVKHSNPKLSVVRVVPEEAELIRYIFGTYKNGKGLKAITNKLNNLGHLTKRGKTFSIASVKGILNNVNYIGKIRYDVVRNNKQSEIPMVDGEHEPIISQELWDAVQERLSKQSVSPSRKIIRSFPLTGILKCPNCGKGMIPFNVRKIQNGETHFRYFYYVCGNYSNKGATVCSPNSIPAEEIEQWVFNRIGELVSQPSLLERIVSSINRKRNNGQQPIILELEQIQKELKDIDRRMKRCFQLYEDGHMDKEELINRMNVLKSQKESFLRDKQHAEKQLSNVESKSLSVKEIKKSLQSLDEIIKRASLDEQRKIIQKFIDKITLPSDRNINKAVIHGQPSLNHIKLSFA